MIPASPKPQGPRAQRRYLPFVFLPPLLVYLTLKVFLINSVTQSHKVSVSDEEWDVLIFTQHWPNTVCMTWEEKDPSNNTCNLPQEKDLWTIHGIWPTKLGTLGPSFCNSSYHFNISALAPIVNNLTQYWIDIEQPEKQHDAFWRHEWRKHGTCSSAIPSMDTELGYFKKGLEWLGQYDMKTVLSKGGVLPDTNNSVDLTSLWLAVKMDLKVNPFFSCIHDKKTHQYYLQEIRICFNKSLQLVDCDGVRLRRSYKWQPLGNCPSDKPIFYPSTVPASNRKPVPPPPDTSFGSLLKVIQFVMWLTS